MITEWTLNVFKANNNNARIEWHGRWCSGAFTVNPVLSYWLLIVVSNLLVSP